MRYRIEVEKGRFLDLQGLAANKRQALVLAMMEAERVPEEEWDAYQWARMAEEKPVPQQPIQVVRRASPPDGTDDGEESGPLKHHAVTVNFFRKCELSVEAPTPELALRLALLESQGLPPERWETVTLAWPLEGIDQERAVRAIACRIVTAGRGEPTREAGSPRT